MKGLKKYSYKVLAVCLVSLFCCGCSKDDLNKFLSNDQNVAGLKEALKIGAQNATDTLGKKDGFLMDQAVKILLPDKAQTTFKAISAITSNSVVKTAVQAAGIDFPVDLQNTLEVAFNRAAEDAAPSAVGVFTNAITNMTITDGKDILFSSNNYAATDYLHEKTYSSLLGAFNPIVTESMKTVKVSISGSDYNVLEAWSFYAEWNNKLADVVSSDAVQTALNTAGFLGFSQDKIDTINSVQVISDDLGDYVVGKALNGIFTKVGGEEVKIRTDASARVNKLLQDVFGQLDKK